MPRPYKISIIYAHKDTQYLEELRGHLRPLENAGLLQIWSDREIEAGMDRQEEIVHNLDIADIVLILVSSDYYDSADIHEKNIKHALSRHERVLPVIVRHCSFRNDPVINHKQVLPTNGKPVTGWQDRDYAWSDVVAGVERTIDAMHSAENQSKVTPSASPKPDNTQEPTRSPSPEHQYISITAHTAKLVVEREPAWTSAVREMGVYVDDEKLGTVANGQNIEFWIPAGRRKIAVKIGGFSSDPVFINLGKHQTQKVIVGLSSILNPIPFVRVVSI